MSSLKALSGRLSRGLGHRHSSRRKGGTSSDELFVKFITTPGFTFHPSQFDTLQTIGSGASGSVVQCRHSVTGQVVALKMIPKAGCSKAVGRERKVVSKLMADPSPFVIKTYGTFQDEAFLYYVMEFVKGGELYATLRAQKHYSFEEVVARFYLAEVILYLHDSHMKSSVIHRDLKPENIMLGEDGHIKVIDFGFAKEITSEERSYTLCGTAEYTAPEVITEYGYGFSADHWALGVILYEMLTGQAPFCTKGDPSREPDYAAILAGKVKIPDYVSASAASFIRAMLVIDPSERLGATGGLDEIMAHEFLSCVDWVAMSAKKVKPPMIPRRASKNVCFITPRASLWTGSTVGEEVFKDFSGVIVTQPKQNGKETLKETSKDVPYRGTPDAMDVGSYSSKASILDANRLPPDTDRRAKPPGYGWKLRFSLRMVKPTITV